MRVALEERLGARVRGVARGRSRRARRCAAPRPPGSSGRADRRARSASSRASAPAASPRASIPRAASSDDSSCASVTAGCAAGARRVRRSVVRRPSERRITDRSPSKRVTCSSCGRADQRPVGNLNRPRGDRHRRGGRVLGGLMPLPGVVPGHRRRGARDRDRRQELAPGHLGQRAQRARPAPPRPGASPIRPRPAPPASSLAPRTSCDTTSPPPAARARARSRSRPAIATDLSSLASRASPDLPGRRIRQSPRWRRPARGTRLRARRSREATVPRGMPSTSAISAVLISSNSCSTNVARKCSSI